MPTRALSYGLWWPLRAESADPGALRAGVHRADGERDSPRGDGTADEQSVAVRASCANLARNRLVARSNAARAKMPHGAFDRRWSTSDIVRRLFALQPLQLLISEDSGA